MISGGSVRLHHRIAYLQQKDAGALAETLRIPYLLKNDAGRVRDEIKMAIGVRVGELFQILLGEKSLDHLDHRVPVHAVVNKVEELLVVDLLVIVPDNISPEPDCVPHQESFLYILEFGHRVTILLVCTLKIAIGVPRVTYDIKTSPGDVFSAIKRKYCPGQIKA